MAGVPRSPTSAAVSPRRTTRSILACMALLTMLVSTGHGQTETGSDLSSAAASIESSIARWQHPQPHQQDQHLLRQQEGARRSFGHRRHPFVGRDYNRSRRQVWSTVDRRPATPPGGVYYGPRPNEQTVETPHEDPIKRQDAALHRLGINGPTSGRRHDRVVAAWTPRVSQSPTAWTPEFPAAPNASIYSGVSHRGGHYTYRQRGPIRERVDYSMTTHRRVGAGSASFAASYGSHGDTWNDFVDAGADGRNYVASHDRCTSTGSCYPSTGDLLIGRDRQLTASSTCGQRGPQIYCDHDVVYNSSAGGSLSGRHSDNALACSHTCDNNPHSENYFGVENIVKTQANARKRWQSEPGVEEVTIDLNLEAEFHFTHLIMTFHTFRPKAMVIEKSDDNGLTFKPIAYFAQKCAEMYPQIPRGPKKKLLDVVCEEKYSQLLPKHDGKLLFTNLVPRDEASKKENFRQVEQLLRVTNLRFRFERLHTLGDESIGASEALRPKYYYAVKSLIVRGSCSCYGHASACVPLTAAADGEPRPPSGKVHGKCDCIHNTDGENCNRCQPLFNDVPWEPASRDFAGCRKCECNQHADSCVFDENIFVANGKKSGGRCLDCRHNTAGPNCELCQEFFYRDSQRQLMDPHVCLPCRCNSAGSQNEGRCQQYDDEEGRVAGKCHCKQNVHEHGCDRCKPGFWNLSDANPLGCQACECDSRGIRPGSQGCDERTGSCACKENIVGTLCDACAVGYYGLEEGAAGCKACDCDRGGSLNPDHCNLETGQCACKPGVRGRKCDQMEDGYFVPLPDFLLHDAEAATEQRNSKLLQRAHAQSNVRDFTGVGYLDMGLGGMSELRFAVIPWTGKYNVFVRGDPKSHDQELEVTVIRENDLRADGYCKKTGAQDKPREVIKMKTLTQELAPVMQVCLEKDTPVRVRLEVPHTYSPYNGSQLLVDSVVLMPNYESLDVYPKDAHMNYLNYCIRHIELYGANNLYDQCKKILFPAGMEIWNQGFKCECFQAGSLSNICEKLGGQCECKPNVVGRRCDMCDTVSWGLEDHEECIPCNCDPKGSRDQFCDSRTGKCNCRDHVYGDKCDECAAGFWGDVMKCQRCECNGRAERCDPKTAHCIDCRENTAGAHCDVCVEGYFGDPLRGIPCRPCHCPGTPDSGNNHAISCALSSSNEMYCQCMPGYRGEKCDECDSNHYGDLTIAGGTCHPCPCNGNIDLSLEGNCDPVTGDCLRCLYNTEGTQCERCKQGHWKNGTRCVECVCHPTGSRSAYCNADTGACECLPNVVGDECDRCAPGHFNFTSSVGCEPCACDPHGSVEGTEAMCSPDGQCHCRSGRGGKRCNECSPGYHGDPAAGCYRCECDGYVGAVPGVCHSRSGHCVCREGMAGPRCDQCGRGYKGEAPRCEPCDKCFAGWNTVIGQLDEHTRNLIDTAKLIKQTGTSGIHREFKEIEQYLSQTRDILSRANITGLNLSQRQELLDDLKNLLDQVEHKLVQAEAIYTQLIEESLTLTKELTSLDNELDALKAKVRRLEEDMTTLQEQNVMGAYNLIKDNIKEAKEYQTKGNEVRKLIEDSASKRDSAARLLDRGRGHFNDVHDRNEKMLLDLNRDIGHLELSVPQINRHLCASETSVEGCKHQCGGVGCDHCGDQYNCTEAAVQKARHALQMARDVQQIVRSKQARAGQMRDDIEAARSSANQAHGKAQEAHRAVATARDNATDAVNNLKELLDEVETLLAKAVASPEDIRSLARDCLELKVQLTPQQIQELSGQIQDTIHSLSDIDRILRDTEDDKMRTAALKNKADKVKTDAQKILGSAEAVLRYLEDARQSQEEARTDLDVTGKAVSNAKTEIQELGERGSDLRLKANDMLKEAARLSDKLKALQKNKTEVNYKVGNLNNDFTDAQNEADQAHTLSQQLSDKYQETVHEIDRKTLSDTSNKGLADGLRQRAQRLNSELMSRMNDLQLLEDTFVDNEKKVKLYDDEVERLLREMEDHQLAIDQKTRYYQTCIPK